MSEQPLRGLGKPIERRVANMTNKAVEHYGDMLLLQEAIGALRAWMNWMDSPGHGTEKTLDDEEKMLGDMRAVLAKFDGRGKG